MSEKIERLNWSKWVPVVVLVLIFVGFSVANEAFLTERNLTNLSRQVSINCILAFGMTIIILLGAIDLGIGSLLALGSVVAALLQVTGGMNQAGVGGAILTMLAVIATCCSVGAFTGFFVSKFRMPPFVVTLGILVMARGLALILSGGSKISPLSESYRWLGTSYLPPMASLGVLILASLFGAWLVWRPAKTLSTGRHLPRPVKTAILIALSAFAIWVFYGYRGIPTPVFITAMVFGGVYFLLNQTTFGRSVYAIGGNEEAARLCGIRVPFVFFMSFVLMGFLVAIASMVEGTRIDAGDPNAGQLYELDAIAAVVIGGTSLQGGIGTLQGTLLGALLMGTMNNGMSLMNIPTHYQMVIKGGIIILAVLMDVTSKKKA